MSKVMALLGLAYSDEERERELIRYSLTKAAGVTPTAFKAMLWI